MYCNTSLAKLAVDTITSPVVDAVQRTESTLVELLHTHAGAAPNVLVKATEHEVVTPVPTVTLPAKLLDPAAIEGVVPHAPSVGIATFTSSVDTTPSSTMVPAKSAPAPRLPGRIMKFPPGPAAAAPPVPPLPAENVHVPPVPPIPVAALPPVPQVSENAPPVPPVPEPDCAPPAPIVTLCPPPVPPLLFPLAAAPPAPPVTFATFGALAPGFALAPTLPSNVNRTVVLAVVPSPIVSLVLSKSRFAPSVAITAPSTNTIPSAKVCVGVPVCVGVGVGVSVPPVGVLVCVWVGVRVGSTKQHGMVFDGVLVSVTVGVLVAVGRLVGVKVEAVLVTVGVGVSVGAW